jgi:hypothetical protein
MAKFRITWFTQDTPEGGEASYSSLDYSSG